MLSEKQEEIMEAIWCAAENKNCSLDAIKKRCVVGFTENDLSELEQKGMIVRSADLASAPPCRGAGVKYSQTEKFRHGRSRMQSRTLSGP